MKISFGEVKQPLLWEVHIYPLGKMHSICLHVCPSIFVFCEHLNK